MTATARHPRPVTRRRVGVVGAVAATLLVVLGQPGSSSAAVRDSAASVASAAGAAAVKPTVVLVHGAFADASGWSAEVRYLTRHGFPVIAPANPLRDLAGDARYIHDLVATIPGPVVLVGHSYGGAVIAAAAKGAANVKALVYVSAFIPEQGRPAAYYTDGKNFPGSLLSQDTLLFRPTYNPVLGGTAPTNDFDVYINPVDFRAIFAADRSPAQAALLAAEQRPVTASAYYEQSTPAARLPSWDLISLDDKAIPPAAQRYMAQQAGARVTAIHSAHDSLISHPDVVDDLIVQAAAGIPRH